MDFKQAGLEVIHASKKEGLDHVDALIERTEELEVQIREVRRIREEGRRDIRAQHL